jgi:DnaJ-class molecular chaperone
MTKFEEISKARQILEIPEVASMEAIKSNYRRLLAKWHPDKCLENKDVCAEMTRKIISAYRTIADYCLHYQYSFSEDTVKRHRSPEEWWHDRFGDDPLWGNGGRKK